MTKFKRKADLPGSMVLGGGNSSIREREQKTMRVYALRRFTEFHPKSTY